MRNEESNQHLCSQQTKANFDFSIELRKSSLYHSSYRNENCLLFVKTDAYKRLDFFVHCCESRAIRKSPFFLCNQVYFLRCYRSSVKRCTGNGIPKGLVRCMTSNLGNFFIKTLQKLLSVLLLPKIHFKASEKIIIVRGRVGAQQVLNCFNLDEKGMSCLNLIILASQ